jgi:uncharacterized membrane protein YraQ (UPF0718 family)
LLVLAALANRIGAGLGALPGWLARGLDLLGSFAAVLLGIFIEAAPFLLLGVVSSAILEVFIRREEITGWFPRSPFLGALAGSLVGFVFPVGECGVVPLARRLVWKGAPVHAGLAALLAGPALNPVALAATLVAFGPGFIFWGRLGMSLAVAVLVALIFSRYPFPTALLREGGPAPGEPQPAQSGATPTPRARLRRGLFIAVDEFFEMGRSLVLGAALAAALQTFVPRAALASTGQGSAFSALALAGQAGLLSVGSAVDAFLALAFSGVFSAGSMLAFLVLSPVLDIKNVLLYLRVLRPGAVLYLALLAGLITLIFCVSIDYLGQGW